MRQISYLILIVFLSACHDAESNQRVTSETNSNLTIDKKFVNKFNFIFSKTVINDLRLEKFSRVEEYPDIPLISFQSHSKLNNEYFFKFIHEESEVVIHILDNPFNSGPESQHTIHKCYPVSNEYYIDYFTSIKCDLSFMNDYGFRMTQKQDTTVSTVHDGWHHTFNSRWSVDSCSEVSKFTSIEFTAHETIRTVIDSNYYEMDCKFRKSYFISEDSSLFKLRCGLANDKKMLLIDEKDSQSVFYYMSRE